MTRPDADRLGGLRAKVPAGLLGERGTFSPAGS